MKNVVLVLFPAYRVRNLW